MPFKMPRFLIAGLLATGTTLYFIANWLERDHATYLSSHPVEVNLLSGAIGFCFATLVVTVAFEWIIAANRAREVSPSIKKIISTISRKLTQAYGKLPNHWDIGVDVYDNSPKISLASLVASMDQTHLARLQSNFPLVALAAKFHIALDAIEAPPPNITLGVAGWRDLQDARAVLTDIRRVEIQQLLSLAEAETDRALTETLRGIDAELEQLDALDTNAPLGSLKWFRGIAFLLGAYSTFFTQLDRSPLASRVR
jgi:hypothetical protein